MKAKKVLVIGGTGHIGSYLVPLLMSRSYEVTVFSRGTTRPYPGSFIWKKINQIKIDRERDEKNGNWQERISNLEPDIIVDLICFEPDSAQIMAETIDQEDIHLLTCGTAWIYGKLVLYQLQKQLRVILRMITLKKADIEKILLSYTQEGHIQATLIHPTHITGPGNLLLLLLETTT